MNYFFNSKDKKNTQKSIEGKITALSDEGVIYNEHYLFGKHNLFKIAIDKKEFYLKTINEDFIKDYEIGDIVNFKFFHKDNKSYIIEETLYKKIKPINKKNHKI